MPTIPAHPFLDETFHAVQRGISSSLSLSLHFPPLLLESTYLYKTDYLKALMCINCLDHFNFRTLK